MYCPACFSDTLRPYRDEHIGLEIDSCSKCAGVWFDAHELAAFMRSDELKQRFLWIDPPEPHAKGTVRALDIVNRSCPRDRMVMQQRIFAGITLDRCPQCRGLWFDDGEIRRVVERWQKGRGGMADVESDLREGTAPPPVTHTRKRVSGLLAFLFHFHSKGEQSMPQGDTKR